VCWYWEKRRESLEFLSELGYKTVGGATNTTPGASGILCTT